jgi:ferredoxin-thioredoxin reductase catalytic subunit
MKVSLYADKETAQEIRDAMRAAGGHCPCVLPSKRNEDTLCMCKAFRESPAGTVCHCGLYIKKEN